MAKPRPKPAQPQRTATFDWLIVLGLIVAAFAVYSDVGSFDFLSYDDNLYVYENPNVQAGLTLAGIKWAMSALVVANWVPVTMLSHQFVCQFFHLQSGMHHLANLFFHILATLLLFATLKRATGSRAASAFVAAVFSLHPLHVESVAWISERKDVLSAFFFFLALYAYVRYAEHPDIRRYLLIALTFALGLMAKPMLVTFPFVLLLFDLWPLRRLQFPRIIWEKLPLLALSLALSIVAYLSQRDTGALSTAYPIGVRIQNALIAYVVYLGQFFWPAGLAVLYPYQQQPALWQAIAALVLLTGITAAVIYCWRSRPYLATGWFWYLGMLVPVIGLVQVGLQSRADRYMYLPSIGLLLMLAWGALDVIARWPQSRMALTSAAVIACVAFLVVARVQAGYWQNSDTLFEHSLDVTRGNYIVEYNLGNYLMNHHRVSEALPHLESAVRIKPDYEPAQNNLGTALGQLGRLAEAIPHFQEAVRIRPELMEAQLNLAISLARTGREQEALPHYEIIEKAQPTPEIEKIIEHIRSLKK
ncbi:MAG TPA: tetratricopeptide repeat protein [Bryobacteraceae bacterium]|jgi:tetratricopeptide (TPR) repeat protein